MNNFIGGHVDVGDIRNRPPTGVLVGVLTIRASWPNRQTVRGRARYRNRCARRDVVVLIHPRRYFVGICAERESAVMKNAVPHIVNPARQPFHGFELVVLGIESEVDARNAAVTMFHTLLLVNVDVKQAEQNAFKEAFVEWQAHACFLL